MFPANIQHFGGAGVPSSFGGMSDPNALRLDAQDTVWFKRQLEFVDQQLYEYQFPENRARALIPTQQNIPDWARVYTWSQFKMFGKAKIVANMGDDIPRADATGEQNSKIIKPCAASYGYDIFEIKGSRQTGTPLDQLRAMAARFAIETEIDEILAKGSDLHKLEGLLNQTGTTVVSPRAKTGGGTAWSATATATEMAGDLFDLVAGIILAMKGAGGPVFQRFTVILPIAQYNKAAQTQMGNGDSTTVLRHVLANSPWIEAIEPWYHAAGAGAGGTDRIVAYPRTPLVVAGIVPMEFTTMAPDLRNLEYIVNALATTGGVVVRYPVAVGYMDGV